MIASLLPIAVLIALGAFVLYRNKSLHKRTEQDILSNLRNRSATDIVLLVAALLLVSVLSNYFRA